MGTCFRNYPSDPELGEVAWPKDWRTSLDPVTGIRGDELLGIVQSKPYLLIEAELHGYDIDGAEQQQAEDRRAAARQLKLNDYFLNPDRCPACGCRLPPTQTGKRRRKPSRCKRCRVDARLATMKALGKKPGYGRRAA